MTWSGSGLCWTLLRLTESSGLCSRPGSAGALRSSLLSGKLTVTCAVLLFPGLGPGDVLRAALCFPSFLHSCEPPIIHGNLTSDTIFIQHNGLIKIGSGRQLLPAQAPGANGRTQQEGVSTKGHAAGDVCVGGAVPRGFCWAEGEKLWGPLGDHLSKGKAWSYLLFSLCPLLHPFSLVCFWIGAAWQFGTGCLQVVSVPLPPLLAHQSHAEAELPPLWAQGTAALGSSLGSLGSGDLGPFRNHRSCHGPRGVSHGCECPAGGLHGRERRQKSVCFGAPICARSPGETAQQGCGTEHFLLSDSPPG